jgi:signal transduction histidine kinase
MLFARPPALCIELCDLAQLASKVVSELQEDAQRQGTRLQCARAAGPLQASVDRTHLAVALKAIVQNSLEALKSGGEIEVHCTQSETR